MHTQPDILADRILRSEWDALTDDEHRLIDGVLARLGERPAAVPDTNAEFTRTLTVGERAADRIASFGGSWTFILLFLATLAIWAYVNARILGPRGDAFDPYPFILLNLFLSMIASLQAPIIMMSQNRQATRDRLDAANDYQVNVKAELEIRTLHAKLDLLREVQWAELLQLQQEQLRLIEMALVPRPPATDAVEPGIGGTPAASAP